MKFRIRAGAPATKTPVAGAPARNAHCWPRHIECERPRENSRGRARNQLTLGLDHAGRATEQDQKDWTPSLRVIRSCMHCKTVYLDAGRAWLCEHWHKGLL